MENVPGLVYWRDGRMGRKILNVQSLNKADTAGATG